MKADGDFEGREGHQAPFTLRKLDSLGELPSTDGIWNLGKQDEVRLVPNQLLASRFPDGTLLSEASRSAVRFFDLRDHCVEIWPFAGVEFGMERFAIGADFEGTAARWNQGERCDAIAEFENLSRQTDGFWGVVSNRAVFDSHFGLHLKLLSMSEVNGE